MKELTQYINESIMKVDESISDSDINAIELFLQSNYSKSKFDISKKPNKDGKYEVSSKDYIHINNKDLTSLTNGMFVWKNVGGLDFSNCHKLMTLDGIPEEGDCEGPYDYKFNNTEIKQIQKELKEIWKKHDYTDFEYEFEHESGWVGNLDVEKYKFITCSAGDPDDECSDYDYDDFHIAQVNYCDIEVPESIWGNILN